MILDDDIDILLMTETRLYTRCDDIAKITPWGYVLRLFPRMDSSGRGKAFILRDAFRDCTFFKRLSFQSFEAVELRVFGKDLSVPVVCLYRPLTGRTNSQIIFFPTPSQCNAQSVLYNYSLPRARSDLLSHARVSFRPARDFYGPVAWLQDGFKMAAAASRLNPPLNFHTDLALLSTLYSLWDVISCCPHARLPLTAPCQVCQC